MSAADPTSGRARRRRAAIQHGVLCAPSSERRALYHCNYCQKDISTCPRIKCAVCPDFDLCLECFSVGAEVKPHRAWHNYRVVDNLSFPLYVPDWGADEEMLLLEAMDAYGLGNWVAVADHVGPTKTALQCKAHYFQVYVNPLSCPLPSPTPEMARLLEEQRLAGKAGEPLVLAATLHGPTSPQGRKAGQRPGGTPTAAAAAARAQPCALGPGPATADPAQQQPPDCGPASAVGAAEAGSGATVGPAGVGTLTSVVPVDGCVLLPAAAVEAQPRPAPDASQGLGAAPQPAPASDAQGQPQGPGVAVAEGGAAAPAEGVPPGNEARTQVAQVATADVAHLSGEQQAAALSMKKLHSRMHPQQPGDKQPPGQQPGDGPPPPPPQHPPAQQLALHKSVAAQQGNGATVSKGGTLGVGGKALSHKEPKPMHVNGEYAMGYHVKREEFDPEYDNDAEHLIADMDFSELDTEEDRAMKIRMLEIYNKRLDERERRHAFLSSYGLLSMRKVQALERRRTPAERDTHARMRVFARFSQPKEHDELVEGMLVEQRLRARLQELKEYRRLGVRTLEEAEVYESDMRKLKKQATLLPPAATGTALGLTGAGDSAALTLLTPGALNLGGLMSPWGDLASLGTLAVGAAAAAAGSTGGWAAAPPLGGAAGLLPGAGPSQMLGLVAVMATAVQAAAKDSGAAASAMAPPVGGNKYAASTLAMWRGQRGVPLDITCLPGTEMLTARERELCVSIRLMPVHYLALKDMMLRDCSKHGAIARHEARSFFRLDPVRCLRLYDLWVACGWVSSDKAKQQVLQVLGAAPAADTPAAVKPEPGIA